MASLEAGKGSGAIPKTSSRELRQKATIDYKQMHEGTRHKATVSVGSKGSSGEPLRLLDETPDKDGFGAVAAADLDPGHEDAEKVLHDLDREIEELETSLKVVHSQLKAASLRKERQQRSDRLDKLRRELFVAEQQLQQAEEEGELKRKDSKSRKLVTETAKSKLSKTGLSSKVVGDSSTEPRGVKFKNSEEVTLTDLRSLSGLNSEVDRQMSALGIQSEPSQSDNSTSTESDTSVDFDWDASSQAVKRSKKKSRKSGLYKKSSDTVKFPQIWPHSALQFEYVSDSVSFMSLDISKFVAGEIEVVLSKRTGAEEKLGMLKMLRKIMYFANLYEWKALLKFYAAWVRRIEVGLSSWSDNPSEIETPMLACCPLRSKVAPKKEFSRAPEQVWWCPDYNKLGCNLGSSHQKVIKGQSRSVSHFCSVCHKNDKVRLDHPKSSSACPYSQK